jgi:glycosyltransferase involved in cell wall biosynthesis
MISVIIPCRNHGHLLREAVDSASAVSRAVEVVVVNDGSTDDSGNVAEDCARADTNGTSVRVFHQPHAGATVARNRGFAESHGECVVFLDADDRLAPNALDIGARALDEHPECVFVYGRCQIMSADGTLLPTPQQPRIEHHAYHELLRNNSIWTPANVMFRRDALKRCGAFNPTVTALADYELYLRLARTHPIHDHGQIVTHYRRHDSSASASTTELLRETLMVLRSQLPYVDGDPEAMAAFRDGWRSWQDFYGSQLVNEIRTNWRGGEWVAGLHKAVVLGVLHPRALLRRPKGHPRRVGAIAVR